jgi:hypothetical protein
LSNVRVFFVTYENDHEHTEPDTYIYMYKVPIATTLL